jgi:hypothetical protein
MGEQNQMEVVGSIWIMAGGEGLNSAMVEKGERGKKRGS